MIGYKLLKFATFCLYWLGFVPWLVLTLRKGKLINANSLQDMFLQYSTTLLILIIVYLIIYQVFEYLYLRHMIKKTVRKVTVRHQLMRLERGEINLKAAQRISTFTELKEPTTPQAKKKVPQSCTKQQCERQAKGKINKELPKGPENSLEEREKKQLITQLERRDKNEIFAMQVDKKVESLVPPLYEEAVIQEHLKNVCAE